MNSSEPEGAVPIYVDADDANADWPKARRWDVWTREGDLVTTIAQLRHTMSSFQTTADLKALLRHPGLPPTLRREIEAL